MRLFFCKKQFICINTIVKRFDALYRENYLKYHSNPMAVDSLDPRMFSFFEDGRDPELIPAVRTHFLRDIQSLNDIESPGTNTRVLDYVVVDSALIPYSDSDCPVSVVVQLNTANLHDVLQERLINAVKQLNERKLTGTNHFVNYTLTTEKINPNFYKYIYHPFHNKWVKKPRQLGN